MHTSFNRYFIAYDQRATITFFVAVLKLLFGIYPTLVYIILLTNADIRTGIMHIAYCGKPNCADALGGIDSFHTKAKFTYLTIAYITSQCQWFKAEKGFSPMIPRFPLERLELYNSGREKKGYKGGKSLDDLSWI